MTEQRRKSKKGDKLGDVGLKDLNLRPVSGGLRRGKQNETEDKEKETHLHHALPTSGPGQAISQAGPELIIPVKTKDVPAAETPFVDTPRLDSPHSLGPQSNLIKSLFKKKFQREDFVIQLMQEGMIEGVLNLIGQVAQFYLKGLPAGKVIDELAKLINREQGAQQEMHAKIAAAEQELQVQLGILSQLQQEHDELKKMEETRAQKISAQAADSSDAKHLGDDKSKKLKAVQSKTTPRKK